jgi:hypothetical protein
MANLSGVNLMLAQCSKLNSKLNVYSSINYAGTLTSQNTRNIATVAYLGFDLAGSRCCWKQQCLKFGKLTVAVWQVLAVVIGESSLPKSSGQAITQL